MTELRFDGLAAQGALGQIAQIEPDGGRQPGEQDDDEHGQSDAARLHVLRVQACHSGVPSSWLGQCPAGVGEGRVQALAAAGNRRT